MHRWVEDYGGRIWNQQKRMGISVDWERQVRWHCNLTSSRLVAKSAC